MRAGGKERDREQEEKRGTEERKVLMKGWKRIRVEREN